MAIDRKCGNCRNDETNSCDYCTNFDFFEPREELVRQDEKEKIIAMLKDDLAGLDLTDYGNSMVDENYAVADYINSKIELLEKEQ